METLIAKIFDIFSMEYMLSVILASYFVIKIVDALNGDKIVPTWGKRTITCIVGAITFFIFELYTDTKHECLIASFFAAVFMYDAAINALLKKLNIEYRS